MKIARESWVIAAIGVADLVTTIIFIRHHGAEEANPLFHHYWEMGLVAFILAKMVCLLGPLLVLEWARNRNPKFVSFALRGAIVGYIMFYGIGFMRLNGNRAMADESSLAMTADSAQLFAASARCSEERALLSAQKLPHAPRPLPALEGLKTNVASAKMQTGTSPFCSALNSARP